MKSFPRPPKKKKKEKRKKEGVKKRERGRNEKKIINSLAHLHGVSRTTALFEAAARFFCQCLVFCYISKFDGHRDGRGSQERLETVGSTSKSPRWYMAGFQYW